MNTKSQQNISSIIIPIIIIVAIMGGGMTFIAMNHPQLSSSDNTFANYNRTYSKFTELSQQTDEISNAMRNSKPESGVWGLLTGLINTGYQAIQSFWLSLSTFTTLINDLNYLPLDIPVWFTAMIVSLIFISFVLAVIALYFRWNP